MRTIVKLSIGSLILVVAAALWGQATTKPTTVPVKVSDAARPLIDSMTKAYASIKSLDVAGKVTLVLDAGGEKQNDTSEFTGSFQAPAKFRNEVKDDALVLSDEKNAYVYLAAKKRYITVDAPKERAELADLPDPVVAQLEQQNPSLLLTLVKDAGTVFTGSAETADRGADVTLDGVAYQALLLKSPQQEVTALIDPKTGLLRRMTVDMKAALTAQSIPKVNTALLTIDYPRTIVNAPVELAAFTWTPPADALLVRLPPPGAQQAGPDTEESLALENKPAPNFTLNDLSGKPVSLAEQKGQVVVLDFWATWCGPCVESLPHLDALNKQMSAKGVKIFAIDLQETKPQVEKFLADQKLTLPVLMDMEGKVGKDLFKVQGIPQTVVIGKDGVVRKVIVGYGPGGEDQLRQLVEAALK